MKNSWQILTLLLAVALLVMTVKFLKSSGLDKKSTFVDKEQVGIDLIMTRSSVRSYTTQVVEPEKIETLLRAGMAAPTAGNRQPWELLVVTDSAALNQISKIISGAHMAAKATTAIVVCGTPSRALMPEYWVQDCSAVTENILLAAHAMDLGAVWCGAYPNNAADRVGQISKLFSIPDGTYALSIIVVGYPDKEPTIKDKWKPEKVYYEKF